MSETPKKRKVLLKALAVVAVLIVVVTIALPFVLDANQFRPVLESKLSSALGRAVKVGNLKVSLWSGSIVADDLAIADDPKFSPTPFVSARSLHVGVEMKPLIFSRVVNVTSISLENPDVTLVRTASGEWNFSTLGAGLSSAPAGNHSETAMQASGMQVSVDSLHITHGRVTIVRGDAHLTPLLFEKVNVTARNLSFTSVFPFVLSAALPGGGSAKLDGKAGPMNRADLSLTPLEASFNLSHFDPVGAGFIDPSSGLGGLLDFDCSLISDGREVRTKGRARAERLQFVKAGSPTGQPAVLDYALRHNLRNPGGIIEDTKVTFGNAVAHLGGQYDLRGNATILKMKLHGENLPVEDLQAILPAAGIVLPRGASLQGGTLSLNMDTEGPIENMVTTGALDLSETRLTGYDLGAQLAAVASLVGIQTGPSTDIQRLASQVRLTPDGVHINGFTLIAPSLGQITGDGVVGANRSLDFKMQARVSASRGLAGGLARLAGSDAVMVPFFIRGTTENPQFVPDAKGVAGSFLGTAPGTEGSSKENALGGILKGLLGKKKK